MRWRVSPRNSPDLLEQLLLNRGIRTKREKEHFFNPKIEDFENILNIDGIKKSTKRILSAIKNNELIIIYGDYDADGICAATILYKALTSLGARVLPYIPNREKEGYGLSKQGIDTIKNMGASLVVTVDNGISACNEAKYANKKGLDLIITDHHLAGKEKPEAYAIIHSTKMCGAAVAWCLIRNLTSEAAKDLLQFVAIATICDLIPLIGLGRAFVAEGLKILNKTGNPGLRALINQSLISSGNVGSFEVGYIIGPRLNAMGRIGHAIDSLRMLCTKDPIRANRLAKLLCDSNLDRQQMTHIAYEEAQQLVDIGQKIHVLASKEWSAGIIGLVAGRICEQYSRPAIAISVGEEISKGSARSVDGINIVDVIKRNEDLLIKVGGHPGAAGFSLYSKNIEIFKNRLEKQIIDMAYTEPCLEIEAEIESREISEELFSKIQKLEPFGQGNKKPVFFSSAKKISAIKKVGDGKHIRGIADGIDFIGFNMVQFESVLMSGSRVDLAYTLEQNNFNGFQKIQLKLMDVKSV